MGIFVLQARQQASTALLGCMACRAPSFVEFMSALGMTIQIQAEKNIERVLQEDHFNA